VNQAEHDAGFRAEQAEQVQWPRRLWVPVAIAAVALTIVLAMMVSASKSAWFLLGAGRGFVPEEYYHVSGFALVLATTFGQAVGWAGGSAIGFYVMTVVGFRATWTTARIAMSLMYLGLAGLPLSVYHALYGQWLLGIPPAGLGEWLAANHPDAHWLLITAHPIVDWSLIPLGVIVLGILWGFGEQVRKHVGLQTIFWLALLGTSLAVALSLGIHSTLVHIRL
jgi:hypothetical protein